MGIRCVKCNSKLLPDGSHPRVVRVGRYYRKSDGKWVIKYHCEGCGAWFSTATEDPCFGQNKRHLNDEIGGLLTKSMSQRAIGRHLGISRHTVARKLKFLGAKARQILLETLKFHKNLQAIFFDEMETHEHSKCKPLSIHLGVTPQRHLICFEVARMPAKGKLAKISRKKYGPRVDERPSARERFLKSLEPVVAKNGEVHSDKNPHYPPAIQRILPGRTHVQSKGRRGCVTGQGELKALGFDPLFALNHTCAMLRDNIKRLSRKTWCTTKDPARLIDLIALYAVSHNKRVDQLLAKKLCR